MKFDLIQLFNGKKEKITVHTVIEKDKLSLGEEIIDYKSPITIEGNFRKKGNQYIFNGKFNTSLLLDCSRCLKQFEQKINMDVEEIFSKEPIKDEKIIENNIVDLYEIVEETLVMNLPIKKLCRDTCKGLCTNCGINLNTSSCKCSEVTEDVEEQPLLDPRLAKLKNLLDDNK
ncbi:DUF177 domain-containing protein [Hathewaya histolytica]|uniref:Putative metal-binding protein, possibly nucleic-acid binding protein n=1 Tax=Hathewaya histolytica TaxID=1498 RepID=A0A4U9RMG0_HATHI|nr:DUF177 domain-containing protein [Hathewaya histolytica]VTQ90050.1 putative metal-binding protein, possibly nucleic-acid binding protein [Hathewaya histolytica]